MTEDPEQIRRSIRDAFDERAATYDENAMHRALAARVAEFADLDGVEFVLDVATGTGLVLRAIEARRPGLRMTGVDLSAGMLDIARRELPGATWAQADAVALPVTADSVDLITCVTALHIIVDTASAVSEWSRVLAPGGRVVTATFAGSGDAHAHAHAQGHGAAAPRYPRVHEPFASAEALARTIAPAGLRLLRHEVWTYERDAVLIAELTRQR